jgi:hypothetical protein
VIVSLVKLMKDLINICLCVAIYDKNIVHVPVVVYNVIVLKNGAVMVRFQKL